MHVKYSDQAEDDLADIEKDKRETIKAEIGGMAQSALPNPENYDVELVTWDGELRYRLKLVDPNRGLHHRVLFRFVDGGAYIEVLGIFPDRDELDYK